MVNAYFLAFGEGGLAQGTYYEGDKNHWKDAVVPRRPELGGTWIPNPNRPGYEDWKFDGLDGEGGSWSNI